MLDIFYDINIFLMYVTNSQYSNTHGYFILIGNFYRNILLKVTNLHVTVEVA